MGQPLQEGGKLGKAKHRMVEKAGNTRTESHGQAHPAIC